MRNQGSVSLLQRAVTWPSQAMSMSAFQNTAPFLPQTGTDGDFPASVLYRPSETREQDVTSASRSAAPTAPSRALVGVTDVSAGSAPAARSVAGAATARVIVRIRTVGPFCPESLPFDDPDRP